MTQMAQGTASVRFLASALGAAVAEWTAADPKTPTLEIPKSGEVDVPRFQYLRSCAALRLLEPCPCLRILDLRAEQDASNPGNLNHLGNRGPERMISFHQLADMLA